MGMVPHVARRNIQTTAGLTITSVTGTNINSKGIKCEEFDTFAVWLDISVAGGTSPTLDIDFEHSEDSTDGVDGTFATIPVFLGNSTTTVDLSMNQITTTTGAFSSVQMKVPTSQSGWVRAAFVSAGTSPAYTIDSIKWILRNPTQV